MTINPEHRPNSAARSVEEILAGLGIAPPDIDKEFAEVARDVIQTDDMYFLEGNGCA